MYQTLDRELKDILDRHKDVLRPASAEDKLKGHQANINIEPEVIQSFSRQDQCHMHN